MKSDPWVHKYPEPKIPVSIPTKPDDPLHHPLQKGEYIHSLYSNLQFIDKYNARLCQVCEKHRPNGAGWAAHRIAGWICKDCKDTPEGVKARKKTKKFLDELKLKEKE